MSSCQHQREKWDSRRESHMSPWSNMPTDPLSSERTTETTEWPLMICHQVWHLLPFDRGPDPWSSWCSIVAALAGPRRSIRNFQSFPRLLSRVSPRCCTRYLLPTFVHLVSSFNGRHEAESHKYYIKFTDDFPKFIEKQSVANNCNVTAASTRSLARHLIKFEKYLHTNVKVIFVILAISTLPYDILLFTKVHF
jgi:hypothetical protein